MSTAFHQFSSLADIIRRFGFNLQLPNICVSGAKLHEMADANKRKERSGDDRDNRGPKRSKVRIGLHKFLVVVNTVLEDSFVRSSFMYPRDVIVVILSSMYMAWEDILPLALFRQRHLAFLLL